MPSNPPRLHRKSIRLKGYDYSLPSAYFFTICTHNRECILGEIVVGAGSKPALNPPDHEPASRDQIVLNKFGWIVKFAWDDLVNHNLCIELDQFVIMPNHVHGIIHILDVGVGSEPRAGLEPAPTNKKQIPLSEIIRQFKTFSARQINILRNTPTVPVWQRNYYEHIIRDDEELNRIRLYIESNPSNWDRDDNNPDR
jgi:putative transposase